ncbi:hypothetical protein ACTXT7_004549 [Hymenolepis weldensis]
MNFSVSTKDPKGFVNNFDETFARWYTQYRNIYEINMADLTHATRTTMLLHKANKSDHDLCSSYLQPMDPANLTYEKMVSFTDSALVPRFIFPEENQFRCLIFILGLRSPRYAEIRLGLLSPSDRGPDVKKSRQNPNLLRDQRHHHRDCPSEDTVARTATKMATKKAYAEILLRAVQRGRTRTTRESTLAPISNAVRLYASMLCEAPFQEKTIFKECYVIDPNITLAKKYHLDTYCRAYEVESSHERIQPASTCCRNPYSAVETEFSQDSALTYHSGLTNSATCTTVTNSYLKESHVILFSSITNRSAISILSELKVYKKRLLQTQVHSLTLHFAKFRSDRLIFHSRGSLTVLGQSARSKILGSKFEDGVQRDVTIKTTLYPDKV